MPERGVPAERRRRMVFVTSLAVLGVSLAAFLVAQYSMPPTFRNPLGVYTGAVPLFSAAWPLAPRLEVSPRVFSAVFLVPLLLAWAAYLGLLLSGRELAVSRRRALATVAVAAVAFAVFFAPALSTDSFAYVGWARMHVLSHLDPYRTTLLAYRSTGDAAAAAAPWDTPTPYGPVWSLACSLVIAALAAASLVGQLIALKLAAACGAVAAAWVASRIAGAEDDRRAGFAVLAVGLNPLVLIEGPGVGHNDITMIALMLGAVWLFMTRRPRTGALAIGLSAGIKYVTASMAPWLIAEEARSRRLRGANLALYATLFAIPFFASAALLRTNPGTALMSFKWFTGSSSAMTDLAPPPTLWLRAGALLVVYAALSWWLWRKGGRGDYLLAWPLFALCMLALFGRPYPWYLTWPSVVAMTRWNRYHTQLALACAGLSAVLMARYGIFVV